VRAASFLALAAVLVSGIGHLAFQHVPRPWSTLGHIDIAELLASTPIFESHWPYWTFPFEYHPIIGYGSALLSYLTGDLLLLVVGWIIVVALCARTAGALLARRVGTRRAIVFWSLAPQLVLFGGQNFDAIVVLSLLVATSALGAGRPVRAGLALAVGAATKLVPLVGAPPYAIGLWREGRRRAAALLAAATVVGLLALDLPAIIAPYSLLRYGVTPYGVSTWNVDSIWLPVAIALDPLVGAGLADALIAAASVGGIAVTYALLIVRPAWRGADPERLLWIAVAIVVLWTRLRSPQYAIWLLPLFALYVPDVRLLLFMLLGDLVTYVSVFALRGTPRDLLAPELLPLYALIVFGVVVRQVAVVLLLLRARVPAAARAGP
jgi:hypothetical protein